MTGEQECTMVGMVGWEPVSQPECSRRRVALAGRVIDKRSQTPIAGAVVVLRRSVDADGDRVGRTQSRSDGLFYFMDLRTDTYRLHVSAPHLGTRYGEVAIDRTVDTQQPVRGDDVALPPTCITGEVADPEKKPVAGAQVRLVGDTRIVVTGADGCFEFSPLPASNPTIEITAQDFKLFTQSVSLECGKEKRVEVKLESKRKT
jgi:hypothetical protein